MPPRPPLTHFLCLPLVTSISRPQLQKSLFDFATEVTKPDKNGKHLAASAIRGLSSVHFTIGVMNLQSPEQIQAACEFLQNLDIRELLRDVEWTNSLKNDSKKPSPQPLLPQPVENSTSARQPIATLLSPKDKSSGPPEKIEPLIIALTNLSPMQSPTATSSLYASPNPLYPIFPFAQRLHDLFLAAGFLLPPPSNRPLKLHATLVNTIYTTSAFSGKNRWRKGSGKIDASQVIDKWGETTWAEGVRVEKVAICEMGAKKVKNEEGSVVDEVYTEVASVALP